MPISTAATYGTSTKSTRGCPFFCAGPIWEHLVYVRREYTPQNATRSRISPRPQKKPAVQSRTEPQPQAAGRTQAPTLVTLVGGLVYWSQIVEAVALSTTLTMADGHDAWYRRELDRGRRFHGAFAGGFSAGYHNTVGSAEGWQPASFRSSRTKRQRVAGARPEEIGDAEDGLLGRTVAVGAGYGSRAGDAAGPATAGARAPSEAPHRHGARLVRLLRRRRKRRRYATGAGEEDEGDRAPLSRAAAVPMLDGARFCVGYDGALERSSGARVGRDVYRVDDVLGGAGGGRATRTPALRDAGGAAPRGRHPWSRRLCRRGPAAQALRCTTTRTTSTGAATSDSR